MLLIVAVSLIVTTVHWPAISAQALSFDDTQYLTENPLVQNPSWDSARRFLTEIWRPSTVEGYYQPLAMISLMLDCALGGGTDNLRPFHVTSLLLHVANTILLIVLLQLTFRATWPAALAGLLFGLHPLSVESVAWISERKGLLSTFFALLSLILYVRFAARRNWSVYAGVAGAYVLGLLAKPTVVPLPFVLLLMDVWPLRRFSWRSIAEKLPLFALSVVSAVITYVSQAATAATITLDQQPAGRALLTLFHNIAFYMGKVLWPTNLTPHYPSPVPFDLSNPVVWLSIVGTMFIVLGLAVSWRWTRAVATGWLMFFVAIFPTMGVIGFTSAIASNKYAYFPSVGLFLVVTWALVHLWQRPGGALLPLRRRAVAAAVVLLLAGAEAWGTRAYLVHWRNTEALHRRVLAFAPHVAVGHMELAIELSQRGRHEEAWSHFVEAVRVEPHHAKAQYNLGLALAMRGRVAEAAERFAEAVRLKPSFIMARYNLAYAQAVQGNAAAAVAEYEEVLRLDPAHALACNNLARIRASHPHPQFRDALEAVRLAKQACALTGHQRGVFLDTLAAAYAEAGRFDEAVRTIQQALRSRVAADPSFAAELKSRQELYQTRRPYREPLQSPVP